MSKRQFQLSANEVDKLTDAYSRCKDGATRTRYQAVRLYGTGYSVAAVRNITGCSRTSLMAWCEVYRSQGIEGLEDKRSGGNRRKLTAEQIADLCVRLHQQGDSLPVSASERQNLGIWTVDDLRQVVAEWYDIHYSSSSSYHNLFQLCGFRYDRGAGGFVLTTAGPHT